MLVRLLVRLIAQVERADLYEELLIHLELARDEWMMKGKTIDESEDLAIKSFGDSGLIGSQIQQAMFPYRKELLLTLSTASILFSISYYLGQLFGSFDALIWWLVPIMTTSTVLLLLSLNGAIFVNRKKLVPISMIYLVIILIRKKRLN
ncbi:permease prefix domain 1-containing protein [Peribacillus psychrosaccharolyticus]|uniref:permease prefix domain 1-containing protein n=1 Tax=Peribacillus psychrosaccharolyticus TaxID=1407 RepID=UPI003D2DDE24